VRPELQVKMLGLGDLVEELWLLIGRAICLVPVSEYPNRM
jgi:hypothetical protein